MPQEGSADNAEAISLPPDEALETVVTGHRVLPGSHRLRGKGLAADPEAFNLGQALAALPGVSAIRRAPDAVDPVLRGLSGERVRTQAAGVPLYGACPSRMDPPVIYLGSDGLQQAVVTLGMPSVIHGPVGLAGTVRASLDYRRPLGAPEEGHGTLSSSLDSARRGAKIAGSIRGGNRWLDLRVSGRALRLGDYTSGGGIEVPADSRQAGATLSLGLRPTAGHRLWQGLVYNREQEVEYPALPMDNIDTDFWLYGARYEIDLDRGWLHRLLLRGGLSRVDHLMDNRYKANRSMLEAATPARTRSYSGGVRIDLRPGKPHALSLGFDAYTLTRDAVRTRTMVAQGKTVEDHVWPDTRQVDFGAFAELTWEISPRLVWRIGGRADLMHSDAAAIDDPSLGGLSVSQQYARLFGDQALDDVQRLELAGTGNTLLQWRIVDHLAAHVGAGLTMRPAGITERYFAFGPAPGGFQVGNPSLHAEKKGSAELGLRWNHRLLRLELAGHYAFVADYILPTTVEQRDVNGDGTIDRVRGFANIDAQLAGFELAVTARPLSWLSLPLGLSYVRGRNSSDGRDLPEIPPLEGRAAARVHRGGRHRLWGEIGVRFAAAQRYVDPAFGEDETDAFAVLRLRAGAALFGGGLRIEALLDNLLDAEYHEHLTREAIFAAGGLQPGDEIPAPGRRLLLALRGDI